MTEADSRVTAVARETSVLAESLDDLFVQCLYHWLRPFRRVRFLQAGESRCCVRRVYPQISETRSSSLLVDVTPIGTSAGK